MITFHIVILGVDGSTATYQCEGSINHIDAVERFISRHDHEGSALSVEVQADGEEGYALLRRLTDYPGI
jgi:hypothetical protein